MFRRTKARKNGPVKALQPIHSVDGSRNTVTLPRFTAQDSDWASNYHHQQPQLSKDDIMVQSFAREKVKANPYATIKMWRPTSTASSSLIGGQGDDVYRSFTPLTSQGQDQSSPSTKNWSSRNGGWQKGNSDINGYDELPADYSRDNSPAPLFKRASQKDETNDPIMDYESDHSSAPSTKSQNSPGSATASSSSSPAAQPHHPPVPVGKELNGDASYHVVSDGTENSVKLVLSHTYTDTDLVGKDVERLLTELKLTMDFLKASTIDKNPSQLSTCLSDLQSHTKQFIQEAKLMVSSANGSHDKMTAQLKSAVHALAHVFLHGQATMLLMPSLDHAQHLGFQLIKAANSFKSTVSAACLAEGKTLDDPNMKYLMRQAQNLAALLASLVNTIKEVQPD